MKFTDSLTNVINDVQTKDRARLMMRFSELVKVHHTDNDKWQKLLTDADQSKEKVALHRTSMPKINYPDLPVSQRVDEIKKAICDNQVVIIAGETGSGKSTQLPKICLDLGLGAKGLIGHTQPRRLAARSIANRLSEETNMPLGQGIGFKIRFSDQTNDNTFIKVMTDGILLAEIQNDKYLSQYEVIIIDEAHERSLNIDFLLGHIHQILKKRPDLKLIITSATIDQARFAEHFNAPIIEVSGRTYPVEIRYQDPLDFEDELSQADQILRAVHSLHHEKPGDILVFLATERDIHETAEVLRKAQLRHTEVLPLFARLSNADQDKIFNPRGVGRRIILSTNVAETSLTVPGIRYVIDSGDVRISRYSYRTKVQHLPIEPISQASANQRAGRCGRVAEGICIRFYSEEDFLSRAAFTDPEILRTNLASVILQMETLKLGNIEKFPFLEKPDSRMVKDGYRLLHEIGALTEHTKKHYLQITPIGRQIAKFPLDPRLARMLVSGAKLGVLREILIIVSFLSIQDPRERPMQFQQKSDEMHKQDHHQDSDFLGVVNLWQRFNTETKSLSHRLTREYCKKNFLSPLRMREWREVYFQLLNLAKTFKWTISESESSYAQVHQALLSGLLGYIGFNYELKEYLGARGMKFYIFPGSSQFKRTPKWLCAAEITETTKLYGRMIAKIDPAWLESIAEHLTKKHYSEPHWSQKRKAVMASLRITLYGLDIVVNRKVQYSDVDPQVSRELFIRHALVYGEFATNAAFFQKNLSLLEEVEDLEHKARKRDIVIDEETLFSYYDKLIPVDINNGVVFEKWYQSLSKLEREQLIFDKKSLMQHEACDVTDNAYPDFFDFGRFQLPLSYHFDPTAKDDGVTMTVPLVLLDQIDANQCDWLVPGLLENKVIALMRALPKNIRKACVPVPHYAQAVIEAIDIDLAANFYDILVRQLVRITGISFDSSVWQDAAIEAHLYMNYRVVDPQNKVLAEGRDLSVIRDKLRGVERPQVSVAKKNNDTLYQTWDFGEIALTRNVTEHGIKLSVYPCVETREDGVLLTHKSTLVEAEIATRLATRKLLMLSCAHINRTLVERIAHNKNLHLLFSLIKETKWQDELIVKAYDIAFAIEKKPVVRTRGQFNAMYDSGRGQLVSTIENLCSDIEALMLSYQSLHKLLNRKKLPFDLLALYQEVRTIVDGLVYKGFIVKTPYHWVQRISLYLQALSNRLDKAPRAAKQDRQYQIEQEELTHLLKQKMQQKGVINTLEIDEIRWLMYELWISWYSQDVKTIETVSTTRLRKRIQSL
ncbi:MULTISPECIES: ATP-dependent RNA helicase HrpA [Cysteiniphilum]|uniref:ATP-dependent RNA helicase HrpA n=1 Tax=Cysteiniphilum TaxID=2056696 RepID=UPI00177FE8CE|nr:MULTISPECIES: ATP-dependent RNA helicase HrpA [Cysteiniphilum]